MPLTRVTGNIVQESTLPESKLIYPYVNVSGDTMTGPLVISNSTFTVSSGGTNQFVVSGNGYVGIKTPNPSYDLDVNGSLRVNGQFTLNSILSTTGISLLSNGSSSSPAIYFDSDNSTGFYKTGAGTINFSSTGSSSLSVSSSLIKNYSGIYSVSRSASLNTTDNAIEYQSSNDIYYFGKDAANINFRTSGNTDRITINSIGQIGIGTGISIPDILLNVAGRVNASSGYAGILVSDLPTVLTSFGGTGITSYNAGDILYYSSGNTFSKLSAPVSQSLLSINGVGVPSWTSTPLSISYGGTGVSNAPSNGQILIGNGTSYTLNTITAGDGVNISNGSGTIGIAVTNIPNSSLTNSSITINTDNGLSGGGTVNLGSTLTLVSTGVTSIVSGPGISVNSSTGTVTVSNNGLISANAGAGLTVNISDGTATYAFDSNYSPTFSSIALSTPLSISNGGLGLSVAPSYGQVLVGTPDAEYSQLQLIGVGVTITPDFIAQTLTFTADYTGASVGILSKGNSSVNIPTINGPIVATTASNEVLRIDTSKFIGIGTTITRCKIDFGDSQYQIKKIIGLYTTSNSFSGIGLSEDSPGGILIAGTPTSVSTPSETASIGYYSTDGNYTLTRVLYAGNDGKISIGNGATTTPVYTLDVAGDINSSTSLRISGTSNLIGVTDTVTVSTGQTTIDSFSSTTYRSAKYIIQVKNTDNSFYQVSEVLLIHDGATAYITEYGTINTVGSLGIIDVNVSTGTSTVNLVFTPTYPNNKIRVSKQLLGIVN